MNLFQEFALLVVVAIPVLVIVGMNVYLALNGEVDTLLLPFMRDYPPVDAPGTDEVPLAAEAIPAALPALEERLREAA